MAINPQDKTALDKFTMVAKKIIYEPARMKTFLKMLGSKEGALTAVHTVVAAIEKLKPIPPQIRSYLGVNAYMIMVDVAQEVTGAQADPGIVKEVVGNIISETQGAPAPQGQPGMLAQMQEQGEPAAEEAMEGAEPPPEQDPGMLAQMQRRGVPA
jgi:hypothetical protein